MAWKKRTEEPAIIRVIRTIEYIGPEEWIENTLRESLPIGHAFKPGAGGCMITVMNESRQAQQDGSECKEGWKHGA